MIELALAAVAMLVWLEASPGEVRAAAFNVMLIGGVSTVLFNGNPLLRFDGYYVLCDLIGLPNLAQRANRYVMYLVQHYGFGDVSQPSPVGSPGERRWLLGFAVASTGYRMVLTLGIALLLAARYPLVGGLLGAWSLGMLLVWPMVKGLSHLTRSSRLSGRRSRAWLAVALLAGVPALLLFGVAVPYGSWALGVVQLPDATMLHAGTDGIVTRVFATQGSFVHRGDPIVELEEPALPAALAVLQAQRAELRLREDAVLLTDRVSAELLRAGVHQADAAVAMARIRLAEQTIRAPRDGTLVLPEAEDLPGHFIRRGDLLGYVLAAGDVIVRVAVPQDRIDLVRRRTQGVELRLAHAVFRPVPASIQRELPGAVREMPSAALGLAAGGEITTDPTDASGLRAFEQTFLVDVVPSGIDARDIWIGERVYVRFDHGSEPLAWRLLRGLRQLFLRRLDV
jgi:putative peptide zinc metalloprotease protein